MSDSDDGFECPLCPKEDCEHLVLRIDRHGSLLDAGEFLSVKDNGLETLDKAVLAYIRRERSEKDSALPYPLDELVSEVRAEVNLGDPDATIEEREPR